MITHNLIQGTPEWKAFRKNMFNASEAAAMMGISKHIKRNVLLHMKTTGSEQQYSEWVEKNVLEYGHEVEALARPIVERLIGDDLYPSTVSEGKLSASLDGMTMDETIIFEHKQHNAELFESVNNGIVPDEYMPQLQQQLMITGATKVLFVVSDGTEQNMVTHPVYPDAEWFDRLMQGWTQFAVDMENYEHVIEPVKPEADAIMGLPALVVRTRGEVLESNLSVYKVAASSYIANIKTDLQTDEDFANAEENVKFCDKAEKDLEAAKSATLAQASSIDEVMRTIDFIQAELRSKRLSLERLVKSRKETIKKEIVDSGIEALRNHIESIEQEIKPIRMPSTGADFQNAAKNKRTLSSLQNAVDTDLANAKIKADATAKDIRAKLAWCKETSAGFGFLFNDLQQLIVKPLEDFQLAVTSRIDAHKKAEEEKLEAQRKRIQSEEQAKAEAKVRAEQAEIERQKQAAIDAEAKAKAEQAEALLADKRRFEAQSKPVVAPSAPVVAAKPVSVAPAAEEKAQIYETRPSDAKIIEALADEFGVGESKVIEWLLDMDLQTASEQMALNI